MGTGVRRPSGYRPAMDSRGPYSNEGQQPTDKEVALDKLDTYFGNIPYVTHSAADSAELLQRFANRFGNIEAVIALLTVSLENQYLKDRLRDDVRNLAAAK